MGDVVNLRDRIFSAAMRPAYREAAKWGHDPGFIDRIFTEITARVAEIEVEVAAGQTTGFDAFLFEWARWRAEAEVWKQRCLQQSPPTQETIVADTIIALGGRDFVVKPLQLRQLRQIEELLRDGKPFDVGVDVLAIAFKRADQTVDRDTILDLEISGADFNAAVTKVFQLAGFKMTGPAPGEASPQA